MVESERLAKLETKIEGFEKILNDINKKFEKLFSIFEDENNKIEKRILDKIYMEFRLYKEKEQHKTTDLDMKITTLETNTLENQLNIRNQLKEFELLRFLVKYPKTTCFIFLVFYSFANTDVRLWILKFITN